MHSAQLCCNQRTGAPPRR